MDSSSRSVSSNPFSTSPPSHPPSLSPLVNPEHQPKESSPSLLLTRNGIKSVDPFFDSCPLGDVVTKAPFSSSLNLVDQFNNECLNEGGFVFHEANSDLDKLFKSELVKPCDGTLQIRGFKTCDNGGLPVTLKIQNLGKSVSNGGSHCPEPREMVKNGRWTRKDTSSLNSLVLAKGNHINGTEGQSDNTTDLHPRSDMQRTTSFVECQPYAGQTSTCTVASQPQGCC